MHVIKDFVFIGSIEILNKNYYARFCLGNRKSPLSRVVPERIQKSATMQTDEIPTISSAVEKNEESSVSNQRFSLKRYYLS
jgi:hypothetical protein